MWGCAGAGAFSVVPKSAECYCHGGWGRGETCPAPSPGMPGCGVVGCRQCLPLESAGVRAGGGCGRGRIPDWRSKHGCEPTAEEWRLKGLGSFTRVCRGAAMDRALEGARRSVFSSGLVSSLSILVKAPTSLGLTDFRKTRRQNQMILRPCPSWFLRRDRIECPGFLSVGPVSRCGFLRSRLRTSLEGTASSRQG